MGRLIDEDVLIGSIPDLNAFEEEDFCTSDMVHLIEDTPTVEAIPKADYENRLKADMVAMLTEIQLEIEETVKEEELIDKKWANGLHYSEKIIQQKIEQLKEKKDADNKAYADKSGMEFADMPTLDYGA
jgi:hypothetical protein